MVANVTAIVPVVLVLSLLAQHVGLAVLNFLLLLEGWHRFSVVK